MFKLKATSPKPAHGLDAATLHARLSSVVHAVTQGARHDFESTTATWAHRPKFAVDPPKLVGDDLTGAVHTSDQVYAIVDKGAPAHLIVARNSPTLRFQAGFTPKTTPGVIGSKPGGKFGPLVTPDPVTVQHPGHQARAFETTIKDRYETIFIVLAVRMMIDIAIQSGHKV